MLEKTLESPLDCKEIQPVHPKGNHSWIFIGRTDTEVKLQYFGPLIWRTDSFEKTLMLGKFEGGRRRGWQRLRWLDGITNVMDMSLSRLWSWWWTGKSGVRQSMVLQRVRHDWAAELKATRYLPLCASISSSIKLRCWARWLILFTFSILWTLSSFLDSTFSIQWDYSGSVSR